MAELLTHHGLLRRSPKAWAAFRIAKEV